MKKYLWMIHLVFGVFGLYVAMLGDDDSVADFSFYLILFSVVALLCLVYLSVSESKSKPGK